MSRILRIGTCYLAVYSRYNLIVRSHRRAFGGPVHFLLGAFQGSAPAFFIYGKPQFPESCWYSLFAESIGSNPAGGRSEACSQVSAYTASSHFLCQTDSER